MASITATGASKQLVVAYNDTSSVSFLAGNDLSATGFSTETLTFRAVVGGTNVVCSGMGGVNSMTLGTSGVNFVPNTHFIKSGAGFASNGIYAATLQYRVDSGSWTTIQYNAVDYVIYFFPKLQQSGSIPPVAIEGQTVDISSYLSRVDGGAFAAGNYVFRYVDQQNTGTEYGSWNSTVFTVGDSLMNDDVSGKNLLLRYKSASAPTYVATYESPAKTLKIYSALVTENLSTTVQYTPNNPSYIAIVKNANNANFVEGSNLQANDDQREFRMIATTGGSPQTVSLLYDIQKGLSTILVYVNTGDALTSSEYKIQYRMSNGPSGAWIDLGNSTFSVGSGLTMTALIPAVAEADDLPYIPNNVSVVSGATIRHMPNFGNVVMKFSLAGAGNGDYRLSVIETDRDGFSDVFDLKLASDGTGDAISSITIPTNTDFYLTIDRNVLMANDNNYRSVSIQVVNTATFQTVQMSFTVWLLRALQSAWNRPLNDDAKYPYVATGGVGYGAAVNLTNTSNDTTFAKVNMSDFPASVTVASYSGSTPYTAIIASNVLSIAVKSSGQFSDADLVAGGYTIGTQFDPAGLILGIDYIRAKLAGVIGSASTRPAIMCKTFTYSYEYTSPQQLGNVTATASDAIQTVAFKARGKYGLLSMQSRIDNSTVKIKYLKSFAQLSDFSAYYNNDNLDVISKELLLTRVADSAQITIEVATVETSSGSIVAVTDVNNNYYPIGNGNGSYNAPKLYVEDVAAFNAFSKSVNGSSETVYAISPKTAADSVGAGHPFISGQTSSLQIELYDPTLPTEANFPNARQNRAYLSGTLQVITPIALIGSPIATVYVDYDTSAASGTLLDLSTQHTAGLGPYTYQRKFSGEQSWTTLGSSNFAMAGARAAQFTVDFKIIDSLGGFVTMQTVFKFYSQLSIDVSIATGQGNNAEYVADGDYYIISSSTVISADVTGGMPGVNYTQVLTGTGTLQNISRNNFDATVQSGAGVVTWRISTITTTPNGSFLVIPALPQGQSSIVITEVSDTVSIAIQTFSWVFDNANTILANRNAGNGETVDGSLTNNNPSGRYLLYLKDLQVSSSRAVKILVSNASLVNNAYIAPANLTYETADNYASQSVRIWTGAASPIPGASDPSPVLPVLPSDPSPIASVALSSTSLSLDGLGDVTQSVNGLEYVLVMVNTNNEKKYVRLRINLDGEVQAITVSSTRLDISFPDSNYRQVSFVSADADSLVGAVDWVLQWRNSGNQWVNLATGTNQTQSDINSNTALTKMPDRRNMSAAFSSNNAITFRFGARKTGTGQVFSDYVYTNFLGRSDVGLQVNAQTGAGFYTYSANGSQFVQSVSDDGTSLCTGKMEAYISGNTGLYSYKLVQTITA